MSLQLRLRKEGQGMIVRTVAGVILVGLLAFGCASLANAVNAAWWDGQIIPTVPFFEFQISNGYLVSFALFMIGCFGVYTQVVNHPDVAEFLIETETELRKVSWPEAGEFLNATIVVLIAIFLIAVFLGLADIIFVRLVNLMIL